MYEETGYDISPLILPDAFIELQIKEQRVKLYIVPGVPTDTPMTPQTRKEISNVGWIRLVDLPGYSKRDKQANPGIKLYMVTPFLFGLRRWIAQNRHKKDELISVEKDSLEEAIQDEVARNGTANDLIAMLRRQEPSDQGVDLLGMLRNGNTTTQIPFYGSPFQERHDHSMHDRGFHTFQHPEVAPQSSELLQFPPKMEPTLGAAQQSVQSIKSPPPTMDPGDLSHAARRKSLLNILTGGSVTGPSPLDDIKSHQRTLSQSSNAPSLQIQPSQPIDPPKSEHQQGLLSAFKSPHTPTTTPSIPSQSAAAHKNALLAMLKTPPAAHTMPSSSHQSALSLNPKGPVENSVQSSTTATHQNTLLATLKMSPKTTQLPKSSKAEDQRPVKPHSTTDSPQTSDVSTHQNALLSALMTQRVPDSLPLTGHQTSLLTMLKSPHTQKTLPMENPVTAATDDKAQSPLSQVQIDSTKPPIPAPIIENPLSYVLGSMDSQVSKATPSAHRLSPLTARKSPGLPSTSPNLAAEHQSSLFNAVKSPPVPPEKHTSHLLSVLKGSMTGLPPTEKKEGDDKRPQEVTNVHMESLLRKIRSPSTSPALEKTAPSAVTDEPTKKSTDVGALEEKPLPPQKLSAPEENESPTGKGAVSNHVSSLLSMLTGQMEKPTGSRLSAGPSPPVQISTISSTRHDVDRGEQATVDPPILQNHVTPLPDSKPNAEEIALENRSITSLLNALKAPKMNVASPIRSTSPKAIPTESPLPLPKPTTSSAPSLITESSSKPKLKGQQFNFSSTSQANNRIKFRGSPVPGGRKEVQQPEVRTEPKTNGTIDLSKVTLLRRPAEKAQQRGNTRTIHSEKGDISLLEQPSEQSPQELAFVPTRPGGENTPESPLGIEFPFKRRTPSKSAQASPTSSATPTRTNSQSLLALLKGPPAHTARATVHTDDNAPFKIKSGDAEAGDDRIKALLKGLKPVNQGLSFHGESDMTVSRAASEVQPEVGEEPEHLGAEREMKLIAMLEKALARGVPS